MIDYFIISRKLVPLVNLLSAVFDTPWGPHFGIMLTLNARPGEVFQRVLVKPSLPREAIEMQKPQPMKKKPNIECKIERKKARAAEEAKEMEKQQENCAKWEKIFANIPLVETKFSKEDPLQK